MKFDTWILWYERILDDFGFSKEEDERTASILNKILSRKNSIKLKNLIDNISPENTTIHRFNKDRSDVKDFIVFGAGPSLKKDIEIIKSKGDTENPEDCILIAADGATTAVLEESIVPDIIVTDLDGKLEDLMLANDLGSVFVLHAHGNNLNQILDCTDKLHKVLGTSQSKPFSNLYNFGGFTDGDRAVFLAVALGARKIVLAGMDFGNMTTKYSRPNLGVEIAEADEIKKKKLKYAKELVEWVKKNENVEIINLSEQS